MKQTLPFTLLAAMHLGMVFPCFAQQLNYSISNNPVKGNPFSKDLTSKDLFRSAVFIENKDIYEPYQGQKVEYIMSHQGMVAFFTKQGVIYKLCTVSKHNEVEEEKEKKEGKDEGSENALKAHYYYIQMQWDGANPDPQIISDDRQEGDQVYLKSDGDTYKTIRSQGYKKITYKDIYPGIDVEYTVPEKGGIEYNLVVHPGADVGRVKMTYSGDLKGLSRDKAGDIIIKSKGGNITEHAPQSYYASNVPLASPFKLNGKMIQFKLPGDYDHSQTLIIDPWVTNMNTLTTSEVGYIVDYDYLGNLFVYGGGAHPQEYKVVKYFLGGGGPDYTFNGLVAGQNWHAWGIEYDPGSFAVDKSTGKVYIGQGVDAVNVGSYFYPIIEGANQIIRIDSSGNYDNFISGINDNFMEAWGFTYNCANSTILISGGSYVNNINFGILNPVSAGVAAINITGITTNSIYPYTCDRQDIASLAEDPQGDVFAIFSEPYYETEQNPDVGNKIYKLNPTLNGNLWNTPSGYTSLNEFQNHPFFVNPEAASVGDCSGNGYNGLAANNNYVFYYDGLHLKAFNTGTGAQAGSATTVPGGTVLYQGGIAVDNCNNVYVGSVGAIETFTFNGTSFTEGTPISLGAGYTSDNVYDVRYNSANNMLYATGAGFTGIYNATLSATCVTNLLSIATANQCTSATATLTPSNTVSNPVFTYVWTDTAGTIVSQTNSTTATTNTLTGVNSGKYYIKAYMNLNCAASFQYDSVNVGSVLTMSTNDTSLCSGQGITLSVIADTAGGTYTWSPGGQTGPSISVVPDSSIVYTVSYTICNAVDSAIVKVIALPTLTPTVASVCKGDSITVAANPSLTGGTYSWSPGGYTTDSFRIAPTANAIYSVTYTIPGCSSVNGSARISITSPPTLTTNNNVSVCTGNSVKIFATPSVTGGTYSWSPGGATTDTILISPTVKTTYTVTYTLGCNAVDSVVASITPGATLPNTNIDFCSGDSAKLIADPSVAGGTYSWSPGGATTDTILVKPTVSNTFTVTYTVNGCSATGSHVVNVSPQPTISRENLAICSGNSGELIATPSIGGGTYTWSPTNTSDSIITVNPAINTTYTITYNLNGCSATASDTVTVTQQPTLPGTSIDFCSGDSTILIADPSVTGGTYSWSSGGATTDTILVKPTGSITYTVTYNLNGCTATANHIVNVSPQPTLNSSNLSLCPGNTGELVATPSLPGGTINWSPGGISADSISVSPLHSTVYTVSYNLNGCIATAYDTVSVLSAASLSTYNVNLCAGSSAELSVPSAPGATYSWSPGGATTASISVSPDTTSTYTVTYSLNGCSATGTDTVSVFPVPVAGPNQTILLNATVTMAASGAGSWSSLLGNPSSVTFASIADSTTTVSGFTSGGVYSFVWSNNVCSDTMTVTVNIGIYPVADFVSTGTTCIGGCIGFKNESVNATSYLWSFPGAIVTSDTAEDPDAICYDSAGTYNVTLIAYNGNLSDTLTIIANVTIYPSPPDSIIQQGDSLIAPPNMYSYQWLLNGDAIMHATSQTYIPKDTGKYSVDVMDNNGCQNTSSVLDYTGSTTDTTGIAVIAGKVTAEVYPNPLLAGSWNVSVSDALIGGTIEIYDTDGKLIYQSRITDEHSVVDLNIASGVYLMHINSSQYNFIKKLIRL